MQKEYKVIVNYYSNNNVESIAWYKPGTDIRHREDGPAAEYADGTKCWFKNDKLHREDGPAIERSDGTKEWYINGTLHREDGPAIDAALKYYYINGKQLTEYEFNNRNKSSCDGKIIEVDGKKYTLQLIK